MGQGHEGEASRCRCNGRPAQRAPRVRGVAVPQPSGASFPGGKSRLQGTSSVPAAIPGGGGPPPHCQAGLGLNRSPRLACGLRAGPRRLPSVPRLPYWAEGAGEDQAGLARCSKPRPDNPPKCCPAAKRLYFRPLSAKAGLVSSSSWFNPSGWGRTLWQEEGTWKPLVTGLPCQCCLPPTGPGQARPASRDATQSAPLRPSSPARVPGSEAPTPPFPGQTLVRTRKGLGTPG